MTTIGFGLIGCGRIAKNHLDAIYRMPEARLVAVCDVDGDAMEKCITRYDCQGHNDYKVLLNNPEISVVNICTPSGLHARMAVDAANAGKHVIVEKPMAMSLWEADAVIAAAARNRIKVAVVHQNRFNPAIVKLRDALEEGKFGRLTHGAAAIRWHRDENYYKQAPWRGTWAQDGGCLMNQSIHNIDLLQWMLGPVTSVFAYTATNLRNIEGEDVAVAILKFANGALATIEASTTVYPRNLEETLHIFGASGTVVVGGVAVNRILTWRFAGEPDEQGLNAEFKEPPNVYGFGHFHIIQNMIEAIKKDEIPAISGVEGRKALEIILAIYHAVRLKREVNLPLAEEFRIGVGL